MLATLWDVTDRDIDNFSLRILDAWQFTTQKPGKITGKSSTLAESVVDARRNCTLPYLTGSAVVLYGMFMQ